MSERSFNSRYNLIEQIGEGGMGAVWRGFDSLLERPVAVKLLSTEGLEPQDHARLLAEARAIAKLSHPNIVSVFDAGEFSGAPFIVMELVEGDDLHDRPPQELSEIVEVAVQICAALEHAHAQGIVHRDLKPENVAIDAQGMARLMDFGIARSVASRATKEGQITGSVFYLAPELARADEFDGRADLYALGVMLYEFVTGELPFPQEDPVAVISQHLNAAPVPPQERAHGVPPDLNALILALMNKHPEDRPASAGQVRERLKSLSILGLEAGPVEESPGHESSGDPILDIELLGGFRILYGDELLADLDSSRLRSFLAYLMLHRDAPLSRQQVAFLFWPESSEAQARTNLRGLLHKIRQTLPNPADFISADASTIQWRQDAPFRADAIEFERSLDEAQSLPALREAVDHYRGELLPGLYDEWVLSERERLEQRLQEGLERLTDLLEGERRYRSAISYAKRLLLHDPLREQHHRRLIRLYALMGDQASAVGAYQTCVEVLRRELGVEVSPATRQAYEEVLRSVEATVPAALPDTQPRKDNLPTQLTSFIGRQRQLQEVKKQLQDARLLTLTGPGGCGKTRLGLQVAADVLSEMGDGVWLVELGSLADPSRIPDAVASALGVREERDRSLKEALTDFLESKQLLLILDNCEHLLPDAAHLAETLLRSSSSLRVLATSRERLNVPGEIVWQVPRLTLPDAGDATMDELMKSEAIHLFVERGAAAMPTFTLTASNAASVIQICKRLDMIPLAIELAAARTRMFTPEEIAARLDDAFGLLTGGSPTAPSRHKTLRAAMDWSYVLLTPKEQRLLRRLAVFTGGFSIEAAEQVASDPENDGGHRPAPDERLRSEDVLETLSALIDKSMVLPEGQDRFVRYNTLETLRQYAGEMLEEASETEFVHSRHVRYYIDLAEESQERIVGPAAMQWLNRLELELGNLRAALRWALDQGEGEQALDLAVRLKHFWVDGDRYTEGREWVERALSLVGEAERTQLQARARASLALLLYYKGDYPSSIKHAQVSYSIFKELGDTQGSAEALYAQGFSAWHLGDYSEAQAALEQSLAMARQVQDSGGIAEALHGLGHVHMDQGQFAMAESYIQEALMTFTELKDRLASTTLEADLGLLAYLQEDFARAQELDEQSLAAYREMGSKDGIIRQLNRLGDLARCREDYDTAEALYREGFGLAQELSRGDRLLSLNHNLGCVAQYRGKYAEAERLFIKSLNLAQDAEDRKGVAEALAGLAGPTAALGDPERATQLMGASEALLEEIGAPMWPANRLEYERNLSSIQAQLDEETIAGLWAEGRKMKDEEATSPAFEPVAS